ncbi:hypothetical protein ACFL16_03545 [Patescibacteria group bacterium]
MAVKDEIKKAVEGEINWTVVGWLLFGIAVPAVIAIAIGCIIGAIFGAWWWMLIILSAASVAVAAWALRECKVAEYWADSLLHIWLLEMLFVANVFMWIAR